MTRDTAVEFLASVGVDVAVLDQLIAAIRLGARFYVRSGPRGMATIEGLASGEELVTCTTATVAALHTWASDNSLRYTPFALSEIERAANKAGGFRILAEYIDHVSRRPHVQVVEAQLYEPKRDSDDPSL